MDASVRAGCIRVMLTETDDEGLGLCFAQGADCWAVSSVMNESRVTYTSRGGNLSFDQAFYFDFYSASY